MEPHLDRLTPEALGPYLDDWAREEHLVDNVPEAIRLSEIAVRHYRELGEPGAESRALAQVAHFYENAGQRVRAEEAAREAVDVLGADPDGADLARALEVNAYLEAMAGNVLALAPRRCLMMQGNPITKGRLEDAGVEVETYAGGEISAKGCGGPTCLTRPLLRDVV